MFADVRRGLTIAAAVDAATVTDTDGNVVDTTEFFGKRDQPEADDDEEPDEADDDDEAEPKPRPHPRSHRATRSDAVSERGDFGECVTAPVG